MVSDNRVAPSRSVKPRKPVTNANRPIVAVIDDRACNESGVTIPTDDLVTSLRNMEPQIIVTATESATFLKLTQDRWGETPNYNFRVAPIEREIFTGKDNGRRLVLSLTSVAYFGWCKEKTGRGNTKRNRYHFLIDPLTFSNNWLEERTFPAYIKWAQDIRDFCIRQDWNLRPTQGSIARQALQDHRFYPEARRKVPRATNEVVRKQLPGNHYQLGDEIRIGEREYEADYLDQSKCHHYQAIQAKLPNSNSLYGYGHFRNPSCGKRYKRSPARVAQFLDGFMGLCYGYLYWPLERRHKTSFVPHYLKHYGTESQPANTPVYFYTEDMPLLESLGVKCTAIVAAWGSKEKDTGLARYAQWALEEMKENGSPKWKKTLLLSPYGALATTARKQTVAFHRSARGDTRILRSKSGVSLPVKFHITSKENEPSTNNVLHRALIEAGNRTETLLFAEYLEQLGYRVLCIYVDGIIVESDEDLSYPLLHPWRLDQKLTKLRFISESQFVSNELEKLPGITGAQRKTFMSRGTVGHGPRLGSASDMRIRRYEAWADGRLAI